MLLTPIILIILIILITKYELIAVIIGLFPWINYSESKSNNVINEQVQLLLIMMMMMAMMIMMMAMTMAMAMTIMIMMMMILIIGPKNNNE